MSREKDLVEVLRGIYPDCPSGPITDLAATRNDPPDVSIGVLAIEVVDYVRGQGEKGGSKLRAAEKLYERITEQAKIRFEREVSTSLIVSVFWKAEELPKKADVEKLSTALAELVKISLPKQPNERHEVDWESYSETLLSNYLDALDITQIDHDEESWWSNPQADWVSTNREEFQKLIRDKEQDLHRYAQKFDDVWLLIVSSGQHISSVAIPASDVILGSLESKFDRVLFFDVARKTVRILKIS